MKAERITVTDPGTDTTATCWQLPGAGRHAITIVETAPDEWSTEPGELVGVHYAHNMEGPLRVDEGAPMLEDEGGGRGVLPLETPLKGASSLEEAAGTALRLYVEYAGLAASGHSLVTERSDHDRVEVELP